MGRFTGFTPQSAYNCVAGPGMALANIDETLLTATTSGLTVDQMVENVLDSGESLGATDDGLEFESEPEWSEWEFAGIPTGVRGGRRLRYATAQASGSFTEIVADNIKKFVPNMDVSDWKIGGSSGTKVGDILTPRTDIVDADYLDNLAILAERQGTMTPMVIILYNLMNTEAFSISLEGDENRSATDVTFASSYGEANFNPATGRFDVPYKIYMPTPAVAG